VVNFRPLLISLLLFGLLAAAVINAGIMIANSNDADESIANNTAINDYSTDLTDSLEGAGGEGTTAYDSFSNSTISLTGGIVFLDAIGGLWKTLINVPRTVFILTRSLVSSTILESNGFLVIFGVITLIILLSIILAVWKLVSTGESG
jgi:hypothetical protein